MTRIYALLFAVALTLNACATAGPIAVKCGFQEIAIAASDYNRIKADYKAHDWADLVTEAEKLGWAAFDCATGDMAKQDPSLVPAREEFRREHAVEFRSAGVNACNDSPAHQVLQAPVAPDRAQGKSTLAVCDAACGKPLTGLATHGRCLCWRASATDWRASRWVPARELPGAGMVAAR